MPGIGKPANESCPGGAHPVVLDIDDADLHHSAPSAAETHLFSNIDLPRA